MSLFNKYLLPGFIFQSLIIGGGYGTGRELVEFFLSEGPVYGLVNMAVATINIKISSCSLIDANTFIFIALH